jgi:hypothetical protein
MINWTGADFLLQMQINENIEVFIRFDEPHPNPLRSLTYYTERGRAYNVHTVSVYNPVMVILSLMPYGLGNLYSVAV